MTDPFALTPLGRTNLHVTRLGLGTAALSWMYTGVPRADAIATVQRAYALGIRCFDTASLYGTGVSEVRLAAGLADAPRQSYTLSTKVGYAVYADTPLPDETDMAVPPRPTQDFSYDATLRNIEGSLKRLNVSSIDVAMIHDPDTQLDAALDGSYRALARLRDEGVIKAIGAGMNHAGHLAYLVRRAQFDMVLAAGRYTLLDQIALDELLPLADEQGFVVYAGGPFNGGLLADPYVSDPKFNYTAAPAAWVQKAKRLDVVCRNHGVSLKAAAIQFPLTHPSVVSVITGASSVAELEENIAAFQTPLPEALWDELRAEGLVRARP